MGLDANLKQQLSSYLDMMEHKVEIKMSIGEDSESLKMKELLQDIKDMSPQILIESVQLKRTPSFSVNRPGEDNGIVFSGVPLGHEFSSLVLALLQVSGRPVKMEEKTIERIKAITKTYRFESYISLSCHNCPDVVQALNAMSILNPKISHTMIDGAVYPEEITQREIMAVPSVYLNGEFFDSGRMSVEEILEKLGENEEIEEILEKEPYDVLVVGGGPAGVSAAVYAARKGIRTGVVAKRIGGQVADTVGIENFISVPYTEGAKLATNLETHMSNYNVDVMKAKLVKAIKQKEQLEVMLENGSILQSKTVILATGARWRTLGVPGEAKYKNKGVAYCPHCDGPVFKGKDVAVIGGGNSGIEAAIDLAGIVKHVTVFEFLPELKADKVLQEKLYSLPNVTVMTNVATKEITGDQKVNGITYIDRETKKEGHVPLQGVFVQIGLVPNTEWLDHTVEKNKMGEIIVDKYGATNIEGVFAAGDCTDSAYKQIIISMGAGATASLSAFDYIIRK